MKNYDKRSGPRITRIELSQKNIALRVVLIAVSLVIGVSALSYGLTELLSAGDGWQEVEVSSAGRTYADDFTLQYYFGASGISASAENKQITELYTEAMEQAYLVFNRNEESDTVRNLNYLNAHVNESVEVDPMLYDAIAKMAEYGSRYLYLAPAYLEYDQIFLYQNSDTAALYDPMQNDELKAYVTAVGTFAADPNHIDLQLLGNGRVRLFVSEEYLAFAEENEIEAFLDFSWTRNAFIVDYVADMLSEKGFTRGYIVSYDGFTRNLDDSGNSYTLDLFNRVENTILPAGSMEYTQPISIVYLRDYPLSEADWLHYYGFSDGRITTIYLDPADGMSKSAVHNLVSYSHTAGCVDVLLQAAPVFIADSFNEAALHEMEGAGVYSIWGEGETLRYNDLNGELAAIKIDS